MEENYTVSAPLRILCGGKKLFGPGIAALLEGIRQNGSIRRTASEMGMSYNKAWGILRNCEQALGFPLLERQVGGVHGGGAKLTAQGADMLARYQAFDREAQETLHTLLQKHFGGMEDGQ